MFSSNSSPIELFEFAGSIDIDELVERKHVQYERVVASNGAGG